MKDNLLDGHRGKVALSDTTKNLTQQQQQQVLSSTTGGSNNSGGGNSKCDLKTPSTGVSGSTSGGSNNSNNDGATTTNFDDDYNEWELGIGDLIIDLDADIEKTNERNNNNNTGGCGTTASTNSTGSGNTSGSSNNHHTPHHLQNGSIGASTSSSATSLVSSTTNSTSPAAANSSATAFAFLGTSSQTPCTGGPSNSGQSTMSNSKSSRNNIGATNTGSGSGSSSSSNVNSTCVIVGSGSSGNSNSSSNSSVSGAAIEHQATVDKGLKMKIKRKTVGNKYSEAKHEIVQSDTKASPAVPLSDNVTVNNNNSGNCVAGNGPSTNLNVSSVCTGNTNETPKSKHSSGKGRNSGHREKKEKNRDKDKNSSCRNSNSSSTVEVNGVLNVMSPSLKITSGLVTLSSPNPQSSSSSTVGSTVPSPLTQNGTITSAAPLAARAVVPGVSVGNGSSSSGVSGNSILQTVTGSIDPLPSQQSFPNSANTQAISSSSNSPPMPNLTLKIENKYSPTTPCSVLVKQEEMPGSPPLKRIKMEPVDKTAEVDGAESPIPPEMKDTSTCTSVGTITEPDCLGPCEPGTSVMLEGIVWQETEGGVLVVNVTWRGKTYVGTLLDCTKHDWAPPRFCESPTSDVDSKATKGRGKRGRGANNNVAEINTFDTRNCVQSKLRNGKGRRTTINSSNFTVPSSPAKSDGGNGPSAKRKGRPVDLEITATVTPENKAPKRSRLQSRGTPMPGSSNCEFSQPSSPVLIECPEPNCNKKYKHINGLRYHQQHAHSSGSDGSSNNKMEDTNTEDSKDVTNSSDNEESAQENISVPPSPAMTFTNAVVSPHTASGRTSQGENANSSNLSSLPESDLYNLTPDLSTLASVAINDSKSSQKNVSGNSTRLTPTMPSALHSADVSSQELPVIVSVDGTKNMPSVLQCASSCSSSVPASAPSVISVGAPTSDILSSTLPVVAATTSVIHSSASDTPTVVTPAVTVSIPTSHVVFSNQGIPSGISSVATCTTHTTTVAISCHNSTSHQPTRTSLSTVSAATYVPVASVVANVSSTSPSAIVTDKSKVKQPQQQPDRLDKYKPKSPMATPAIRPIVPAPSPQLIALSTNMSSTHPGMNQGSHSLVTTSLKPIQPKPTILGEPTTINPALESLKKEKSKHKKKSKDKDRERKMGVPVPLTSPVKLATHPNEECEPLEVSPYPSLEASSAAATSSRDPLNAAMPLSTATHTATLLPIDGQKPPSDPSLDLSLTDDNINENIQSPAYSDISDANDTLPVLESEVPSGKEKEDKVDKATPDAAVSPAANINAYGMYPTYYSQPPYLLPSVSPQNSTPQTSSVIEKIEPSKKTEQERIKENRPWSNPSGELVRDRPVAESETVEKKQSRENETPNSGVISSPAVANAPMQEYQMQQPYPYSYGYIQGYPYSVDPAYHMQLLDTDPHYKQQYKQYVEDQQRLYKEQQQQQQHQQQQQQQQQQLQHQQQQQQQHHHQSQQHHQQHSHHHHQQQQHHHHSQHQSHHQNKIHHSSVLKDDRDRSSSREHKERSSDKMSSIHAEQQSQQHINKIQHSSMSSLVSNKDHDQRDHQQSDTRPPSLPTQSRIENPSFSSSSAALKEKQNENHQILKENIELKSQMEDNKSNVNRFEMAMIYERHREDMRRYYMYERYVEQHQKMEPGFHHHTHHHQTIHPHQLQPHSSSSSSSIKSHKDDISSSLMGHSKPSHYPESSRTSAVMSPAKSEHIKSSSSHPHSSSSPKGASIRDSMSSHSGSKDYSSSSVRDSSSSKKDSSSKSSERPEGTSSSREEKNKVDKIKVEKPEPEGQKPTMETTGPPPPPTNAYAYLHPSYLQPPPPHFPHMPFEPAAHAVYRSGLNPMIMSTPSYGASPYVHPQLRYVPPGACELPTHTQTAAADPLVSKGLHPPGPPKALDLLHQVSQHYTTHKIHELQEHALMSPTPTSTPTAAVVSSTPSTSTSGSSNSNSGGNSSNSSTSAGVKPSASESAVTSAKAVDASGSRDSSRSPPTQRHLHTHHHTHVGVGYPIYDPYGAIIASPAPSVDVKPIHPLHQVKAAPAAGRYWQ